MKILARLKRHPFSVSAFFRHSLVLTYALPRATLQPLLPPGLVLDSLDDFGFVAIAMVQTEALRPSFLPAWCGQNFFLAGYRIFARLTLGSGRTLRGLRILRSNTDRALMIASGNLLTHYHYRRASVETRLTDCRLEIQTSTPQHDSDLHVIAHLDEGDAALPTGSPFRDWHQARLFAGPLPFTFDYEAETHSIVMIEGVRQEWHPRPVRVEILRNTFFKHGPFAGSQPIFASAFHVENIPYRWKPGVLEPLTADTR